MSVPVFTTAESLRAALASTIACSAQELQEAVGKIVVATASELPTRSAASPEVRSLFDHSDRVLVLLADRIPVGQEAQALAAEIDRHHGRQVAQVVFGDRATELLGDGVHEPESGWLRTSELKGLAFDWAVAAATGRPISGVFEYRHADGPGLHEFSIKAPNPFTPSRNPGTLKRVEAKAGMSAQALLHAKFGDVVQVPPWVMKLHAEQLAIDAQVEVERERRRSAREASDDRPVLFDHKLKIAVSSSEQAALVQKALFAFGCGFHNGQLPLTQGVELGNAGLLGIHVGTRGVMSLSFDSDRDVFDVADGVLVAAEDVLAAQSARELNERVVALVGGVFVPGKEKVGVDVPAGKSQVFSADDILLGRNGSNPGVLFVLGKYRGSDASGERVTIGADQVVTIVGGGFSRREKAGIADEVMDFHRDDVMKVSPLHLARLLRTNSSSLSEEFESRRAEAVVFPAPDQQVLDQAISVDHFARVGWVWAEELRHSTGYMDRVRGAVKDAVDAAARRYEGVSGSVEMDKWEPQGFVLAGSDLANVRAAARDVATVLFRFEGVLPAVANPLQAASKDDSPAPGM